VFEIALFAQFLNKADYAEYQYEDHRHCFQAEYRQGRLVYVEPAERPDAEEMKKQTGCHAGGY